jgi:hypothetical protein
MFCKPVGTFFLRLYDQVDKGSPHLKSYHKFLEAINLPTNKPEAIATFPAMTPQLAQAVFLNIILYMETPYSAFKKTIVELQDATRTQQPYAQFDEHNNPYCHICMQTIYTVEFHFSGTAFHIRYFILNLYNSHISQWTSTMHWTHS